MAPPLAAPVLSGSVAVIAVAPVVVALPGVMESPVSPTLRLPVPVGTAVGGAISVRALIVVIAIVPPVPMAVAVAFALVTPVPVVSLPVSAPVRVHSVSLPVAGRLSLVASRTGLGLGLLLRLRLPFGPCRRTAGPWQVRRFIPTFANRLRSCGGPVGALGATWQGG